jgi:hypothetical protein
MFVVRTGCPRRPERDHPTEPGRRSPAGAPPAIPEMNTGATRMNQRQQCRPRHPPRQRRIRAGYQAHNQVSQVGRRITGARRRRRAHGVRGPDDLQATTESVICPEFAGGAEGTRTPDPHTARTATGLVTSGIHRFRWPPLAANSASLATVATSSGPSSGPTNDAVSDTSQTVDPIHTGPAPRSCAASLSGGTAPCTPRHPPVDLDTPPGLHVDHEANGLRTRRAIHR